MSLIPYSPSREGQEIVLRHQNAIVVRDPTSHRLEVRGLTECPTCHRSLRRPSTSSSPERHYERPATQKDSWVSPEYFRMLQSGSHDLEPHEQRQGPSSPVRRPLDAPSIVVHQPPSVTADPGSPTREQAEFVSSTPDVGRGEGARIRTEAFSPGYFKRFFTEERELGKGGKGVVLLVRHILSGVELTHYACKRVPVGDDHAWLEKVLVEVTLLSKLQHINLVSYHYVWLEEVRLHRFGPTLPCAFILQQYCNGGDLHKYIVGDAPAEPTKEQLKDRIRRRSKGHSEDPMDVYSGSTRLSPKEIFSLFKDITSGVAYLHANGYVHRDLKPSNCLLHHEAGKTRCLISDFGEVQAESAVRQSTGSTGTISYCAPEVLKMDMTGRYGNFTTKSDIFSLGMILYFMCFGRLPYLAANVIQEELEDVDMLRAEITGWQGFQDEQRERPDLPSKLYQLLQKLLALDPVNRPSAVQVLNAMTNEAYPEMSANGGDRLPETPIPMRSGRVQNLDSPLPPSTPVQDPRKHGLRNRVPRKTGTWPQVPTSEEHTSPAEEQNGLTHVESGPPAFATTVMTLSRSREPYREPTPEPLTSFNTLDDSRLLMPPPSTLMSTVRYQSLVLLNRIAQLCNLESLGFLARVAFFVAKLITLNQRCWPFTARLEILVPLLVFAALDLRLPPAQWGSSRQAVPRPSGSATLSGPGVSVLLLCLHFAAVHVASSRDTLCVAHAQV